MNVLARRAPKLIAWALVLGTVLALSLLLMRRHMVAPVRAAEPARQAGSASARALRLAPLDTTLPTRVAVTLVRDPASAGWYETADDDDRALRHWRSALEAAGATVTVRGPAELAGTRAPLVVVSAPCLSGATRQAILRAADAGQGVLLSWLSGTRDAGCRAAGWGLVARLTGAGRADTLGANADAYVTFPAGGPLAVGLPPGARIELRPASHVALRTTSRDALWSDRWLNPNPPRGAELVDGAVVRGTRARVAWIGFELRDVVEHEWDQAMARVLVRNLLAHVTGVPLAAPDAWPAGLRAAAVLAQDVEDEFANARLALDTLRAARAPGSFYVVSSLALQHPDLTRDLARYGELGSHGDVHLRIDGLPPAEQARRLQRTQAELEGLVNRRVAGFRPPEEGFDGATIDAWLESGGRYLYAINDLRSVGPERVLVGERPVVLLPRTANDDYSTVRRARITDPAALAAAQLATWRKIHELGGLYVMSYHSNMLARPNTVAALGRVARALRAEADCWLVTGGEVVAWWEARAQLETSVRADSASVEVRVRNAGDVAVPAFRLQVTRPHDVAAPSAWVEVPALAPGREHATRLPMTTVARAGGDDDR